MIITTGLLVVTTIKRSIGIIMKPEPTGFLPKHRYVIEGLSMTKDTNGGPATGDPAHEEFGNKITASVPS